MTAFSLRYSGWAIKQKAPNIFIESSLHHVPFNRLSAELNRKNCRTGAVTFLSGILAAIYSRPFHFPLIRAPVHMRAPEVSHCWDFLVIS